MRWIQRYSTILKWLIAIGLLVLLYRFNEKGLAELCERDVRWRVFALMVIVRFTGLLLTFERWRLLVVGIGFPFSFRDSARLGLLGEACNFVMPGATGGDLVKAAILVKSHPGRRASAAATVLLDRILGLWALFVAGAFASLVPITVPLGTEMKWAVRALWLGTLGGLIGLSLMLSPRFTNSWLLRWVKTWPVVGRIVEELSTSIGLYQQKPSTIIRASAMSLLGHIVFLTAFYLGAIALHGDRAIPGFVDHLVGLPLPEAFSAAVPAPAGLGALEGAVAWFYQQYQLATDPLSSADQLEMARSNGVGTALMYRMSSLILGAFGVLVFLRRRDRIADAVKSLGEDSSRSSQADTGHPEVC